MLASTQVITPWMRRRERPIIRGQSDLTTTAGSAVRRRKAPSHRTKLLYSRIRLQDEGYAWGMAIDLNACVGCNACVVACQAENNIAVVGKEQVHPRPRDALDPRRPLLPGRPRQSRDVLPAGAVHALRERALRTGLSGRRHRAQHEGLNDMVYNRCVGTRYCSNNCPYKVRRFNFLLFQDWDTPKFKLQRNPDVTVRSRGVMEKCTYCVQRINDAESTPRSEKRSKIARSANCRPPASSLARRTRSCSAISTIRTARFRSGRRKSRNYALLGDLNTRPRTTYLAADSQSESGVGRQREQRSGATADS